MNDKQKNENGTIMLESVFGIFASIIVLMLLLSFGFYLYQKTMFNIVANEIAESISQTYKFKYISDPSEITVDEVTGVTRYRYLLNAEAFEIFNETKGNNIAYTRLDMTSLAKKENIPKVEIVRYSDDVGRMHFKVSLTQKYSFLMGDILSWIGVQKQEEMIATAYVTSVDVSNYINTVKTTNYLIDEVTDQHPYLGMLNSVIGLMETIYKIIK